MLEEWRVFLYYPLGALPSIFFLSRFMIQWWHEVGPDEAFDPFFILLKKLPETVTLVNCLIDHSKSD